MILAKVSGSIDGVKFPKNTVFPEIILVGSVVCIGSPKRY